MTEAEWLASTDPAAMLASLRGERGDGTTKPFITGMMPPNGKSYISDRKLRLFACAVCRQVWDGVLVDEPCPECRGQGGTNEIHTESYAPLYGKRRWVPCTHCHERGTISVRAGGLTDPRSRRAVEVAERYADEGEAVAKEMSRAWLYLDMEAPHEPAWMFAYLTCCPPDTLARDLHNSIASAPDLLPPATQAQLLRCIVGNPFRPSYKCNTCKDHKDSYYGRGGDEICPDCDGYGNPPWITPTVLALARTAYADRDWSLLPVLADALADAGCPEEVPCPHNCYPLYGCRWRNGQQKCDCITGTVPNSLLAHLRGPGPHARGCWAVDIILGKE